MISRFLLEDALDPCSVPLRDYKSCPSPSHHLSPSSRCARRYDASKPTGSYWAKKRSGGNRPFTDVDSRGQRHRVENMSYWKRLKTLAAKPVEVIFFMVVGAMFFSWYIKWQSEALAAEIKPYERQMNIVFWIMLIAHNLLRADKHSQANDVKDLSPRTSGVLVVLLTGLAAATALAWPSGANSPMFAAVTIVGTFVMAAVIWRFATVNAAEIREARLESLLARDDISNGS